MSPKTPRTPRQYGTASRELSLFLSQEASGEANRKRVVALVCVRNGLNLRESSRDLMNNRGNILEINP